MKEAAGQCARKLGETVSAASKHHNWRAKKMTKPRLDGEKTAQRGRGGRFAQGNSGGPGRPRRATESAYLQATVSACSVDDWQGIVAAAVQEAKEGDRYAREWLARYLIGEPDTTAPNLTTAGADDEQGFDRVADELERRENPVVHNMLKGLL